MVTVGYEKETNTYFAYIIVGKEEKAYGSSKVSKEEAMLKCLEICAKRFEMIHLALSGVI
jgi:hypothetical protein